MPYKNNIITPQANNFQHAEPGNRCTSILSLTKQQRLACNLMQYQFQQLNTQIPSAKSAAAMDTEAKQGLRKCVGSTK